MLPAPLPDNPLKWDGWKNYNSDDPYERLCLTFDSNPGASQIEDHCRQLLGWWQKKLPLKNQPSNPISQLLRSGMDEAPAKLADARAILLDPESRRQVDIRLLAKTKESALVEFSKFLSFVLTCGELPADDEDSLYVLGRNLGLQLPEMKAIIDDELDKYGMKRVPRLPVAAPVPEIVQTQPAAVATPVSNAPAAQPVAPPKPRDEFLRMLRLSGIDEITDDQRDAFCNMGEALGLSGGDAEDIIDEYLEERTIAGVASQQPIRPAPKPVTKSAQPAATQGVAAPVFNNSPLIRAHEKEAYPNFINGLGMSMLLIPSGSFAMGSDAPEATDNEGPVSKTNISAFYFSRWPVTNGQYEQFDPSHRSRRAPKADENHPVVYVSAIDAGRFCEWLAAREKRRYRLPSEAEWEYAARGSDGRIFPWGNSLEGNNLANFADVNKRLPWADPSIDCGFSETSPVGRFPRGAGPFGVEDMAGNVWEWCIDCMSVYPGKERTNPRGPGDGPRRVYRGGSWKSRMGSLRTSARSFNAPAYSANDVGFRILCEVK